jgi:hypothetical protein
MTKQGWEGAPDLSECDLHVQLVQAVVHDLAQLGHHLRVRLRHERLPLADLQTEQQPTSE